MQIKFWSENLKGRDHSADLGMEGRLILEWILGNGEGRCGQDNLTQEVIYLGITLEKKD
jgi:hypothetical protein